MGVYLVDKSRGKDLHCNWWNWRPTVALLVQSGVAEPTKIQGHWDEISEAEAHSIADYLDKTVLPKLTRASRIRLDLTITTEPDTGEHFREADTEHLNYAATHEWLVLLRDFCRSSQGFHVAP